jgi:4-hydroxy-tetrahydrodipicolinate reductase
MIRISIAGPRGKMGQEAVKAISSHPNFTLVSVLDHKNKIKNLIECDLFNNKISCTVYNDLETLFSESNPQILIDFTEPKSIFSRTKKALELGVSVVVGTSGLTENNLAELKIISEKTKANCLVIPNFSIAATLMMEFSKQSSSYFNNVEIIESHHPLKKDFPSGTSLKTVKMISENKSNTIHNTISESRGTIVEGIPIHSVRLNGIVAQQQVLFGNIGENFSITHSTFERSSFMPGLILSCEFASQKNNQFIYGLERILFNNL